MPSPFPGMDPYLEAPGVWPDFHGDFIYQCRKQLVRGLPRHYRVRVGAKIRVVNLSESDIKLMEPDLGIGRSPVPAQPAVAGMVATAVMKPVTVTLPKSMRVKEYSLRILGHPGERLVTAIELLSPTNKDRTNVGSAKYLRKRRQLLRQPVHLVEIDLLAGGTRPQIDQDWPPGDYAVFVSRAEKRPRAGVACWSVREPLPVIAIPLLAADADFALDLGTAFATTYNESEFNLLLDYAAPVPAPLSPEDRAWAEQIARAALSSPPPPITP